MIQAERLLLTEALKEPLNDRFLLISDRWVVINFAVYNFVKVRLGFSCRKCDLYTLLWNTRVVKDLLRVESCVRKLGPDDPRVEQHFEYWCSKTNMH